MDKKLFVISLGGSLMVPKEIDTKYLRKFRDFIISRVKKGERFIIVTGGGKMARKYQKALRDMVGAQNGDADWVGIFVTRLNAQMLRLSFKKLAHSHIVDNPGYHAKFKEKILLAAGWTPGRSTDDVAVRMAKTYGTNDIINLSDVSHVYDKDPRKANGAKKFDQMSWKQYRQLFPGPWDPGLNSPFDPVAAKFAEAHKQRVYIANGKDLKNLAKIFEGKKFTGTTID